MYLHDAGQVEFDYRFWTSDPRARLANGGALLNALRPHMIKPYGLLLLERLRTQPETSTSSYPSFLLQGSKNPKPSRKARAFLNVLEPCKRDELYRMLSLIDHGSSPALHWNGFDLCVECAGRADNNTLVVLRIVGLD